MAIDAISATKLAVYILCSLPSAYCLFKHGKTGFFGWLYVSIFCVLRVVTGAMALQGNQTGESYLVLNSIGLSPLMLAISGVLHEVRRLGNPHIRRKLDIFLEVQFHALVGVGMVLTLLAVLKFTDGNPLSQCKTFLYSGSAVTGVAVLLLGAWALSTLATVNAGVGAASRMNTKGARELLYATFFAMPLLVVRFGYGIAFVSQLMDNPKSGFLTSTTVQIFLSLLPEMLIVFSLLIGGLVTRNLKPEDKVKSSDRKRMISSSHVRLESGIKAPSRS